MCKEISSGSQPIISISSQIWQSRCSESLTFVIIYFVSIIRSFEASSDKSGYDHAAGESASPVCRLVLITVSSVKGRLAVSVGGCFCESRNGALLKLFTIFCVSEGVRVLLLVNSKHC